MKLHRALMSVVVLGLCSGCAGTGASYIPIIDGPKDSFFRTDLGACQQLAMERDVLNPDTKTDALIGGIAGGPERSHRPGLALDTIGSPPACGRVRGWARPVPISRTPP